MDKTNYIQLIERFLKGETTEAEETTLFHWFDSEGAKEEILASYKDKWEHASDILSKETQSEIYKKIQADTLPTFKGKVSRFGSKTILRYIAVASISVLIGMGIYKGFDKPGTENNFIVSAAEGMKSEIVLPDGTKVWLNSQSSLTYSSSYNQNDRIVFLDGEGYFEVKKDLKKAFIVNAKGIEIEALGTKFDIKAYKDNQEVTTSLLEGKVSVRGKEKEIILFPNQEVCFNTRSSSFSEIKGYDASRSALWKDNQFYFDNQSLEEIAKILERKYAVEVVFSSETVKAYTFCGIINNTTLFNVLECLRLTSPIEYEIKNSTLYFSEINKKSNLK